MSGTEWQRVARDAMKKYKLACEENARLRKVVEMHEKERELNDKKHRVLEIAIERGMIPLYDDIDKALRELDEADK